MSRRIYLPTLFLEKEDCFMNSTSWRKYAFTSIPIGIFEYVSSGGNNVRSAPKISRCNVRQCPDSSPPELRIGPSLTHAIFSNVPAMVFHRISVKTKSMNSSRCCLRTPSGNAQFNWNGQPPVTTGHSYAWRPVVMVCHMIRGDGKTCMFQSKCPCLDVP